MKKLLFISFLFLSSCGISGLEKNEQIYMSNEENKPQKYKNKIEYESLGVFSNFSFYDEKYDNNSDFIYEDVKLKFSIWNSSKEELLLFGVSPVVPIPPFIPAFLFTSQQEGVCFQEGRFVFEISYLDKNNKISGVDAREIYLLSDKNQIIKPYDYKLEETKYMEAVAPVLEIALSGAILCWKGCVPVSPI